jgi:hypothetical protein
VLCRGNILRGAIQFFIPVVCLPALSSSISMVPSNPTTLSGNIHELRWMARLVQAK